MPSLSLRALCAQYFPFSYHTLMWDLTILPFCCSQLSQMEVVGQDNCPSFEPPEFSLLLFSQGVQIHGLGLSEMYRLCFPPLLLSGSSLSFVPNILVLFNLDCTPSSFSQCGLCPGRELCLVRFEFIGLQTVIMVGCHVSPLVSLHGEHGCACFLPPPTVVHCSDVVTIEVGSGGVLWDGDPTFQSHQYPAGRLSWHISTLSMFPQLHSGLAELGRCAILCGLGPWWFSCFIWDNAFLPCLLLVLLFGLKFTGEEGEAKSLLLTHFQLEADLYLTLRDLVFLSLPSLNWKIYLYGFNSCL